MLESSLQSENITYRPHAARGCVKLQSKHIRNTYDRYTTIITSVDTGHLWASLSEHYRLPHGWIIVGTH